MAKLSDISVNRLIKNRAIIRDMLSTEFNYIFKMTVVDPVIDNYLFIMGSQTYNLQMNVEYNDSFVDVRVFISPSLYTDETRTDVLEFLNYLNWNVKSAGRFYYDDYSDIVYSLRFDYSIVNEMKDYFLKEMETAIAIYNDVYDLLVKTAKGEIDYKKSQLEVDAIWNNS